MTRKIIQFQIDTNDNLHALCDDGTLWVVTTRGWSMIDPIPVDPEFDEPEPVSAAPIAVPAPGRDDLPASFDGSLYVVNLNASLAGLVTTLAEAKKLSDGIAAGNLPGVVLVDTDLGASNALKIAEQWKSSNRGLLTLDSWGEGYTDGHRNVLFHYVTELPF